MAGRDFTLRATPAAAAAIDGLRGRARKSYTAFETELRKQGCRVAGYRLLGTEDGGYSEFCCKRLVDDWRVITTFEPDVAIVVAVGRHDSRAFYAELSQTFAIGAVGQGREEKPACCGKGDGPSIADLKEGGRGFHPGHRVKRVQGHPGVWEMSWAYDGRATFQYGDQQRFRTDPRIAFRPVPYVMPYTAPCHAQDQHLPG